MQTTDFNNENRRSLSFTESQPVDDEAVVYPRNSYTITRSYCEIVQKNKPQSNSVMGGEF